MAIADTINSMKTNITNAYNAIQTKGGTIPTNKNLVNLSTAINSIPAGGTGGGGIEEVSTVEALKAKVTAENAGKVYRYTGTTSGNFINGALYVVHYDDTPGDYNGISYTLFNLGLEIYKLQTAPYTITYNLTDCSISNGDSTSAMNLCGSKKIMITPLADYILPESITVTGCSYNYTRINNSSYGAILELYNPTGNITVTIEAEMDWTPSVIELWYGLKSLPGFEPCIRTWTANQCQIWGDNVNTIDEIYTYVFSILGKAPAEDAVAECTKLLQNNLGVIFKSMGIEWTVKYNYNKDGTFTIAQIMSNGTAASTGTSYIKG